MTLALTKVVAKGIEVEEALNKKYKQILMISYTAANTDATIDIGNYSGTFWTAVGATEPGATALAAIKDIQRRAEQFFGVGSNALAGKQKVDPTATGVVKLTGTVPNGSATPTAAVTGLVTTDTILHATQQTANANSLPLIGQANACAVNAQLALVYSADPGASGTINVSVIRTASSTTVEAGQYKIVMNSTNTMLPDISFASGDAPTSSVLVLEWMLKDAHEPVEVSAAA